MNQSSIYVLAAALSTPLAAQAFEAPLKVDGESLEVSAQALLVQKDEDGDTMSSTLKASYLTKSGDWAQSYSAKSINVKNDNSSNTETYQANAKGMRFFNETFYGFGKAQAYKDVSSAYEYSLSPTFGVGNELFATESTRLVAEVGAGGEYLKAEPASGLDDGFEPVATLGALFTHQFNPSVGFEQEVDVSASKEYTRSEFVSSLAAKISQNLNAKLSYNVKIDDTDVGSSTDQITAVGISFKTN